MPGADSGLSKTLTGQSLDREAPSRKKHSAGLRGRSEEASTLPSRAPGGRTTLPGVCSAGSHADWSLPGLFNGITTSELKHSLAYAFIHLLVHSFIHPLFHSFIHSVSPLQVR